MSSYTYVIFHRGGGGKCLRGKCPTLADINAVKIPE